MPVLIVTEAERAEIARVVEYAKAHPIPLEQVRAGAQSAPKSVIHLEDRPAGFERPPSQHVMFPGGYRAAYSVEQQPAGFYSHLSVSVEGRAKKGMMPSPQAVALIATEFGVPFPPEHGWTEEFDPGEYAVNLLSPCALTPEGNA